MINLKHIGIYVEDIEKLCCFYKNSFGMVPVCENLEDTGPLYYELYGNEVKVLITKLITDYGKTTGQGEMLELIQVYNGIESEKNPRNIQDIGISHFSLGVDDIFSAVEKVKSNGGSNYTRIVQIGEKYCCFCKDPEGNVIELIQ